MNLLQLRTYTARKGGFHRMRRFLSVLACLAVVAVAAPGVAQTPNRSDTVDVVGLKRVLAFGRVTLGLHAAATLTPDYRTGYRHIGISRRGIGQADGTDIHYEYADAVYSRPDFSRPSIGILIETQLDRNLSLESVVLFRSLARATETANSMRSCTLYNLPFLGDCRQFERHKNSRIDIWEMPVTLKYRFSTLRGHVAGIRPFVAAGPAFWIENNRRPIVRVRDPHYGATAEIGIDIQWLTWGLSPRVSYTRWATDANPSLSKNQIRVSFGVSF